MSKTIITDQDKFLVLRDTSEKKGWTFKPDEYCLGTEPFNLYTGDYTIKGLEKEIITERKFSTSELAINIYEKRFEEELKRLDEFPHPFIVCEFTWQDVLSYPVGSGCPERLWNHLKVRAEHLEKALSRYMLKYRVKIIFAGKFGQKITYDLFKYFIRMKNGKL